MSAMNRTIVKTIEINLLPICTPTNFNINTSMRECTRGYRILNFISDIKSDVSRESISMSCNLGIDDDIGTHITLFRTTIFIYKVSELRYIAKSYN